jgi:hypothetical protein
VVGPQLILQVEAREQGILGESVVGNQAAQLQQPRNRLVLLPVAAEQEEDLGLEGVALAIGVEVREEGVLLEHFQEQLGVELRLQQAGQRGLPYPDHAFNGDIHAVDPLAVRWKERRWTGDLAYPLSAPAATGGLGARLRARD